MTDKNSQHQISLEHERGSKLPYQAPVLEILDIRKITFFEDLGDPPDPNLPPEDTFDAQNLS